MTTCANCGPDPHEAAEGYAKYAASLLPKNFQRREMYRRVPGGSRVNATYSPKTGIRFLDEKMPRISGIAITREEVMHMRALEQAAGLDPSEYWHPKCCI